MAKECICPFPGAHISGQIGIIGPQPARKPINTLSWTRISPSDQESTLQTQDPASQPRIQPPNPGSRPQTQGPDLTHRSPCWHHKSVPATINPDLQPYISGFRQHSTYVPKKTAELEHLKKKLKQHLKIARYCGVPKTGKNVFFS